MTFIGWCRLAQIFMSLVGICFGIAAIVNCKKLERRLDRLRELDELDARYR